MVFHMQPDLVWGYFGGIFAEYRKGAIPPMPLTEIQARNSKPRERAYKLADGEGLFLFVQPNGSKCVPRRNRNDASVRKTGSTHCPKAILRGRPVLRSRRASSGGEK